ncbi:hypothetical protein PoB_000386600 [Plakobranchus ocellatus]|uniref:Uncharacterized protein n=1 Tax=Plakobranchus ocellatus TaxID=259542 RepID=A0AAV3XM24_9GAST|nr:hypothetical protein PoB_000386600 [Plakobranchus ocellatus]
MDIFDRKFEKEGQIHKDALKDHVAHYGVLRELASERESSGKGDPNMGRYGPGTSKLEIQPLIQKKIKESTPSAKRKRQSKKILATRKNIKVFDRTKPTSALFKMKEKIVSRPTSEQLRQISPSTTESVHKRAGQVGGQSLSISPRLILPPITVRWARHQIDHGLIRKAERIQPKGQGPQGSVFITDSRV